MATMYQPVLQLVAMLIAKFCGRISRFMRAMISDNG